MGNWRYFSMDCVSCNQTSQVRADSYYRRLRNGVEYECRSCSASRHMKLRSTKHGRYGTPEYISWQKMKDRCGNVNHKYFHLYGGRGISYPEKWKTFEGFLEDMGSMPASGFSLDRIDNERGYSKENCRWIPRNEQQKNRRVCKTPYTPSEVIS